MVTEIKKTNWFKRHWIFTIILSVFLLIVINAIIFSSTSQVSQGASNSNTPSSPTLNSGKQYISEDLDALIILFVSQESPYTDLQKKDIFKQYENKWIKSSGIVKEIDDVMMSSNIVVSIINPDNPYLRGATIYFPSSEKDKLLKINPYDQINFEGRIEDYMGLMGIIIKDAKLS